MTQVCTRLYEYLQTIKGSLHNLHIVLNSPPETSKRIMSTRCSSVASALIAKLLQLQVWAWYYACQQQARLARFVRVIGMVGDGW